MEEWLEDTIIEEREEVMVSSRGGVPYKRKAHILKPNVESIEGSSLKLPSLSPKCKWPLEVSFNGWRTPTKKWKKWVEVMHSKYQFVWKKAGIYDAIMASTYKIRRNNEMIFAFVERWCSETNSFVFPWGEATVTLEDMIVLGGYSVLGGPVSLPLQGEESIKIEEELKNMRKDLVKLRKNCYGQWMKLFMETGNQFEHEGFLSMWLSRFVFPGNNFDSIDERVFPIAIHLARETRIALAPSVLASIYRDMSLLRETMAAATELSVKEGDYSLLAVTVWAPLYLVQIWAWERFMGLRPKPKFINCNEPRVARWHSLKQADTINMRPVIDSAGNSFLWRPYTLDIDNWSFPKFYMEKEDWVPIREGFDENFESFGRCLRVCEIFGIDCKETYQPHRVAMQFGYDQDLPRSIPRSYTHPEMDMSFYYYSRPFGEDSCLFVPSRLSQSDVTRRYMNWWRNRVSVPVSPFKGMVQRRRSARRSRRARTHRIFQMVVKNEPDVPPGFGNQKRPFSVPSLSSNKCHRKELSFVKVKTEPVEPVPDVPPGFPPTQKGVDENLCASMALLTFNKRHSSAERSSEPDVPPGFPPKGKGVDENLRAPTVTLKMCNKRHGSAERSSEPPDVPPGFPSKLKGVDEIYRAPTVTLQTCNKRLSSAERSLVPDVPPGFPPKRKGVDENICAPLVTLQTCNKRHCSEERSSSTAKPLEKVGEQIKQNDDGGGKPNASAGNLHHSESEGHQNSSMTFQLPNLADLEARISRMERILVFLLKDSNI